MASNPGDEMSPHFSSPTTTSSTISDIVSKQPIIEAAALSRFSTGSRIASTTATLPESGHLAKLRSLSHTSNDRAKKASNISFHYKTAKSRHNVSQSFDLDTEIALPPSPVLQPVGRQRTSSSNASTLIAPSRSISWAPETSNEPLKPISWRMKVWNKIPRGTLIKAVFELFGLIIAVVSTFTYTYRSYQISLWQAEYSFYDHCMQVRMFQHFLFLVR